MNNKRRDIKEVMIDVLTDATKTTIEYIALRQQFNVAMEALRFYADKRNWTSLTDGYTQIIRIDRSDEVHTNHPDFPTIRTGGKRASEALKTIEELEKKSDR